MATRFYFSATAASNPVSPTFNANWEQTGQAVRRKLEYKNTLSAQSALADVTVTVPITTSQDILIAQFTSDSFGPTRIGGLYYSVIRFAESATTANVSFAWVLAKCSSDGGTVTVLDSNFATGTEFAVTAATRLAGDAVASQSLATATFLLGGERLVFEVGVHAAGPTAATTATGRFGTNAASDFAFTTALTTDLNPWIEFTADLKFPVLNENFKNFGGANGMSVTQSTWRR